MPGAPSEQDLAKTAANDLVGETSKTYVWQTPAANNASLTEYPLVATRKDPYDNVAAMKTQVGNANNNWVVPFTEADAAYNERKRIADEQALFDTWLMQKYNLADPAQNNMLQQIAPSLFDRREEVINNMQNLITRYSQIRLRGAKSEDDLRFQWLIDTGRLQLPGGPIWDPRQWRRSLANAHNNTLPAQNQVNDPVQRDQAMNIHRFQRGFFSFAKWITPASMGHAANANNMFDIAGTANPYNVTLAPMRPNNQAGDIARYPVNNVAAGVDPFLP